MPVPPDAPPLPRWARAVDILCLVLVAAAVIVAVAGGFRIRPFGVRIALTSPVRPLIAALVLAIVRHAVVLRPPIYQGVAAMFRTAWQTAAVREALVALAGTRLAVLFVGYLAIFHFGYADGAPPFRVSTNEFLNLQARWDVGWYLDIASHGYRFDEERTARQQNIVFFPALPLLMRVVGRVFGGSSTAFVFGGTLLVAFAFGLALAYLFRLARSMLGDEGQARTAVWMLAAYPFALFFSAVYTEALFLLAALGAFYHFRRNEFVAAGAWGLLAGLTRPNGCFLSIPLALLAVGPWVPPWLVKRAPDHAESSAAARPRLPAAIAAAAMPGVGVLVYSAYIWWLAGQPLAWAAGHVAWGRSYQGLATLVADRYEFLADEGLYAYTSQLSADLLQGLGPIFVLSAVWGVARRLGLAYAVFILVNILPPLAAGGFLSAGRFSAVLFPAFVWLASVVPPGHRVAWIAAFMALQGFNAALFYTWRPMF